MKKFRLYAMSCLVVVSLGADNSMLMPPSIPPINLSVKKDTNSIHKRSNHHKPKRDDACKLIPPMLVHLPPMLEDSLDACKNGLYLPSKSIAKKRLGKLLKRSVEVRSVVAVKGFSMLYKIESNVGIFYCNRDINSCLGANIEMIK
jgi:hypothetical protein